MPDRITEITPMQTVYAVLPLVAAFLAVPQFLPQLFARFVAALKRDERGDRLPLHLVRPSNYSRLCNLRVCHQSRFDLHRPQPVTTYIDHVVHAPHQPKIPIRIPPCAIARKIASWNLAPISRLIPSLVSIDRPRH